MFRMLILIVPCLASEKHRKKCDTSYNVQCVFPHNFVGDVPLNENDLAEMRYKLDKGANLFKNPSVTKVISLPVISNNCSHITFSLNDLEARDYNTYYYTVYAQFAFTLAESASIEIDIGNDVFQGLMNVTYQNRSVYAKISVRFRELWITGSNDTRRRTNVTFSVKMKTKPLARDGLCLKRNYYASEWTRPSLLLFAKDCPESTDFETQLQPFINATTWYSIGLKETTFKKSGKLQVIQPSSITVPKNIFPHGRFSLRCEKEAPSIYYSKADTAGSRTYIFQSFCTTRQFALRRIMIESRKCVLVHNIQRSRSELVRLK